MCRHRGAPSASPQVSDRPAGGGVGAEVFQLISGARDGRRAGGVTLFVEDEKLESLLPLPKLERKMFATLPPLVLKLLLLKVLLPRLLPCPLLCPCFERWRECLCALVPGLKSGARVGFASTDSFWSVACSTAAIRSPNSTWVVVVSIPSGLRYVYSKVDGKS